MIYSVSAPSPNSSSNVSTGNQVVAACINVQTVIALFLTSPTAHSQTFFTVMGINFKPTCATMGRNCSALTLFFADASRGSEAASAIAALRVTTASPTVYHVTATEVGSHLPCATQTRGGVSARCVGLARPTRPPALPPLTPYMVAGSLILCGAIAIACRGTWPV